MMRRRMMACLLPLAVGVLLAATPLRAGVVCGESMSPTLLPGALYLLDQSHYRQHPVRRGDVVVFEHAGETYIKRVLAVGGDTVYLLKHGAADYQLVMDWQLPTIQRALRERRWNFSIKLVPRRVPRGTLFVLGDNLQNSTDSRDFGPVPLERVLGRVLWAPPADPELDHVAVAHRGDPWSG